MKNKDTWEFAHKYCGKVWYVCGMAVSYTHLVVFFDTIATFIQNIAGLTILAGKNVQKQHGVFVNWNI